MRVSATASGPRQTRNSGVRLMAALAALNSASTREAPAGCWLMQKISACRKGEGGWREGGGVGGEARQMQKMSECRNGGEGGREG